MVLIIGQHPFPFRGAGHEDVIGSVRLATSTAGAVVAVNEFAPDSPAAQEIAVVWAMIRKVLKQTGVRNG